MSSIGITGYRPEDLLEAARTLLTRPDSGVIGVWPRASAHLCRQALEQTLEDFWRARRPVLSGLPMRVQLTALSTFLGNAEAAASAMYVWGCLSNACHHHAYELAPSSAELAAWIEDVERVGSAVSESLSK